MLIRPRIRGPRGFLLPGGMPALDLTDPINAGRIGCWVVTGEQGNYAVRDIVTNTFLTTTGSPVIVSGRTGMQAQDASGAYWSGVVTAKLYPVPNGSILWFGSIVSTVTGGVGTSLFGIISGGGSNFFNLQKSNSASPNIQCNPRIPGNTPACLYAIPFPDAGQVYAVLGSVTTSASTGPVQLWLNGKLVASTTWGSGTALTMSSSPTIQLGTYSGNYAGAGMSLGSFWNRQLTPAESIRVTTDPTAGLLFPGDMLYAANSPYFGPPSTGTYTANLSDSSITSDTLTEVMSAAGALSDLATTSDVVNPIMVTAGQLVDAAVSGDVFTPGVNTIVALSDLATTLDALIGNGLFSGTFADSLTSGDSIIWQGQFTCVLSDSATGGDSFSQNMQALDALSDNLATADTFILGGSVVYAFSLDDTAATSDALAPLFMATGALADTSATNDGLQVLSYLTATIADSAITTDSIFPFAFFSAGIADASITLDAFTSVVPGGRPQRFSALPIDMRSASVAADIRFANLAVDF